MTVHIHSHKDMDRAPVKSEEALRAVMVAVFKKQKAVVVKDLVRMVEDPKHISLGKDQDKSIVQAVKPVLMDIFTAGGNKALKSIRRFPKRASGKKDFTDEEVFASSDISWDQFKAHLKRWQDHEDKADLSGSVEVPEWLDDPDVLDALENEEFLFAQKINETTADSLRDELLAGMDHGEGIAELKDRIESLFEDWQGYRAERIARTESCRAYSKGHIEAWRSTGVVDKKVWVSADDACPFCLDMNGTVMELDDNFLDEGDEQDVEWGGKDITMSQDYSDVEGPPLHPNCRCALVGQLSEEKALEIAAERRLVEKLFKQWADEEKSL